MVSFCLYVACHAHISNFCAKSLFIQAKLENRRLELKEANVYGKIIEDWLSSVDDFHSGLLTSGFECPMVLHQTSLKILYIF